MKYQQLVKAIDSANQHLLGRAAAAVNQALVLRNWLVGAYVIEFEQHGEDRARYGVRLIEHLSVDLDRRGLKGISATNLRLFRESYRAYPQLGERLPKLAPAALTDAIRQTLSVESAKRANDEQAIRQTASVRLPGRPLVLAPELLLHFSWSRIVELLRLDDPLRRAFYENECLQGNWSVRQLQRQIGSLLYERTGLSKNKKAVVARAHRQEPQATIEDLIRDPYVLEFTGPADRAEYHEADLVNLPSAEQLSRFVETDRARIESAREQHVQGGAKLPRQGRPRMARRFNAGLSRPACQTPPEGAAEP